MLPYRAAPAAATLLALAATQAPDDPDAADPAARPGRIVHEVRHGELAHFGQVPYGRYYGSVDATPLFLVLLGAYTEQTGQAALARRLEPHARAAVGWMLDHGGLATSGYLLHRADEGGHAHHHWKDSPGALCRADGSRPVGAVTSAGAVLRAAKTEKSGFGVLHRSMRKSNALIKAVIDAVRRREGCDT
ncbi:hypothetical protein ADL27_07725 [Streptomyces sp. NRRL F-6602]|nr:hypothetical protein ADL27_07725 [Streptomyces sp. NRRL F-6602]